MVLANIVHLIPIGADGSCQHRSCQHPGKTQTGERIVKGTAISNYEDINFTLQSSFHS